VKFYTLRKEEMGAVNSFRESCVKDKLEVVVSRRAVGQLHKLVKSKAQRLSARDMAGATMTLARRGLIREEEDGMWVVTELGLLSLAFAEAGGLLDAKQLRE
jgi:hypothetical protein